MNRSGRKSTRNANEEPADEIKDLKLIVEKLVQENKELTATVAESIKPNKFISVMFEEYKKSNEKVLKKLNEITKQVITVVCRISTVVEHGQNNRTFVAGVLLWQINYTKVKMQTF